MKKVMIIIPALGSGGGERLAVSIISKMNKQKFKTKLVVLYPYCQTDNAEFVKREKIDTVYLDKKRGIDLKVISLLKKEINEFNPDIIQTHLYVVAYVLLASPRKIIKYHTVHNVAEKEATGVRRFINFIAFHFGNFTPVAISPYCAKTIEKVYHIKRERIPCINNAVDIQKYYPNRVQHEGIRLINIGRLQPQKNQKLLLRVFSKVNKEIPNTFLQIVGEGELKNELQELAKELDIENKVYFAGQCSDVIIRLNSSDIFIQTSDYEGLPISALEAMACGLPLISTAAGGTVDIVENGVNGYIVGIGDEDELVDRTISLVKNKQLQLKMGQASRIMALDYKIEECAEKYESLYAPNEC